MELKIEYDKIKIVKNGKKYFFNKNNTTRINAMNRHKYEPQILKNE